MNVMAFADACERADFLFKKTAVINAFGVIFKLALFLHVCFYRRQHPHLLNGRPVAAFKDPLPKPGKDFFVSVPGLKQRLLFSQHCSSSACACVVSILTLQALGLG